MQATDQTNNYGIGGLNSGKGVLAISYSSTPAHGEDIAHYLTGTPISTSGNSKTYRYTISFADGETSPKTLEINNIPDGTTYSVSEHTTGPFTTGYTNQTSGNGGITNDTTTATVANTYQSKGKLKLTKLMESETPASGAPTKYIFHVVLNSTTLNLENYGITVPGVTLTSANFTNSGKTCTFDVPVEPGSSNTVEVTNIPYDTTYTVTETQCIITGTNVVALPTGMENRIVPESTAVDSSHTQPEVTVYNAYKGTLILNKALETDTTGQDAQRFVYTVKLKAPTGVTFRSTGIYPSVSKIKANPSDADATEEFYDGAPTIGTEDGRSTITFQIRVSKNEPRNITGIPYGTDYTVTETVPDGWIKTGESAVNTSTSATVSQQINAANPSITHTVTNAQKGSLVLKKAIEAGETGQGNTLFTYTVTLTAPSGMTFTSDTTDNTISINGNPITISKLGSDEYFYSVNSPTDSNTKVTFTARVSANTQRTISGLPYGTTYSVSETGVPTATDSDKWVWHKASEKITDTSDNEITTDSNKITLSHPTVNYTITNGLTGELTISKTRTGTNIPSDSTYYFTVTLANGNVGSLSNYTYYKVASPSDVALTLNGSNQLTGNDVSITDNGSITIKGIPYGTICTVTETNPVDTSTAQVSVNSAVATTGRTGIVSTSGETQTVAFTNDYPNTGTLTLKKTTTGLVPSNAAAPYTFDVTLSLSSGNFNGYTITKDGNALSPQPSTDANSFNFTVQINGNQSIVIGGLPAGTSYSVYETPPNDGSTCASGSGASNKIENNIGTSNEVEIINAYPASRKLKLQKTVNGVQPSSMGTNPKYIFRVTLAATTAIPDVSKYASYITLPDSGTLPTYSNNKYEFDVVVPGNGYVEITGIPDGVSYTVEEQTTYKKNNSGSYVDATHPNDVGWTAPSSQTGTIGSGASYDGNTATNTVTVTNTYTGVDSLKLKKTLVNPENAGKDGSNNDKVTNNTNFYYEVVLTNGSVNLTEYLDKSALETLEGATIPAARFTSGSCTVYVPVTAGDTTLKSIGNIPIGTTYAVTEKYKNGSTYEDITNDPLHPHVSYDNKTGAIADSTNNADVNLVEVTNTYRKITITKKDSVDSHLSVNGAKYRLLKLNQTFINVYTGSDNTAKAALAAAFANSENSWNSDAIKYYYDKYTDELTVSDGSITVTDAVEFMAKTDSNVKTYGIEDGYYFFYETTAADNYSKDNRLSYMNGEQLVIKVIKAGGTETAEPTYTGAYLDPRNTATLTLQKLLTTDTSSATYGDTPFTYTVKLTAPTDGAHLEDFITVDTTNGTVAGTSVNSITSHDNTEIVFTVDVSKNDGTNIYFEGLPCGTKYTVTEPTNISGWKQTGSSNVTESTGMTGNVTASYTNAKTGSLELEKALQTGTPADKNVSGGTDGTLNGNQTFSYTVTLVTPDGVVIDSSAHGLTLTNASFAAGKPTVTQINAGEATAHSQVTFTISNVSKNNKVTVSGIPHGTTYYVAENALDGTLTNAGWTKVTQSTTITSPISITYDATGSIGDTTSNATITNGLLGSLNVSKIRQAYVGTVPDESFSLKVQFTNLPASGYSIKKDGSAITLENDGSYSFTLSSSNSYSASFTDIPVGASYEVTEPTVPANWEKTDESNVNGTISVAVSSASITNKYRPSGTLKVNKDVTGEFNKFIETGTIHVSEQTKFPITIELNAPSGHTWSEYTAVGYPNGHAPTSTTIQHTFVLSWSKNDGDFTLTNVPYGSTYTITEVTPTYDNGVCTTTVPSANTSFTWTGNAAYSKTETVTNDYAEKGQLSVSKIANTAPGSTAPNAYPNATFHVELKMTDDTNWSLPTGMVITNSAANVDTSNAKIYAFDVSVPANGSAVVVASNIPKGVVSYKVTEASAPAITDYSGKAATPVNSSNTLDANGFAEITDGNLNASVSITNTYTQLGSLSLTKTKVDTGTISSQTQFAMNVVLTPPGTMTAAELKAYSSDLSSFTADDSSTPKKLTGTVQVTAGTPVALSNIPYGTKIAVEEADGSQNMTSKVEYSTTAVNSGYSTNSVTDLEVNGAKNVYVRNTYPELGSLTITKTIDAMEGDAPTNQAFVFSVTLNPDSSTLVDLNDFTIELDTPATGVSMSSKTVTSGVMTFTVTITGAGSATVTGIPAGTQYIVNEQPTGVPQWSLVSPSVNNYNDYVVTAGTELTFENMYTPTIDKALVLFKQDAKTNAGIPGAVFYLLKLNDGVDITDPAVMAAFRNNDIDTILDNTNGYATNVLETTTDENGYISKTAANGVDFTPGTKYFFYEKTPSTSVQEGSNTVTYINDNTLSPSKVITINADQLVYTVTNRNYRVTAPTGTEVFKTNSGDDPLPDAELDLYYRENKTPSAYTSNSPYYMPLPSKTALVNTNLTVPADQPSTSFSNTTYTFNYAEEKVPSAEDYDWIQPRTDNDYIYFRDYNDGNSSQLAMWDCISFNDGQYSGDEEKAQNGKRSWLWTGFEQNTYKQEKEIEYDHSYWYVAQFKGHPKKSDQPEYGVWERFVDRYQDQDTVVWKIQPPDGYTQVRFLLYHEYKDQYGNTQKKYIRSTQWFTFELGEIYHKQGYGKWKMVDNQEGYMNVNVIDEGTWSTYSSSSKAQTGQHDKRQYDGTNYNNKIYQSDRYTPTQQKIIFHCNSATVWHNIHIEFFTDGTSTDANVVSEGGKYYKPVGQTAPGYLMEPYAYAGGDYRINGFLTYELTIPAEAKYFRVNNGVLSGTNNKYYYSSKVTKLKTDKTRKNYGNYFSINGSGGKQTVTENSPVTLKSWKEYTNYGDKWNETYSTLEVESDYDYIYFEKPDDWSDHVYAYFYAGNDLREDNYNRATYSAWPGVAAVATEYVEKDKDGNVVATYHSDQYTYTYQQNNSTGQLYTSSADGEALNPETIFNRAESNGDTVTAVYKFRLPKSELKSYANGEKRNYDKVIFNDGLYAERDNGISETHETKAITFEAGAQYNKNRTKTKSYSSTATVGYTKRGSGDDYIYIRTTDTTNWDDIHIKFYNANGERILQSGSGYVMEYAGKQDVGGTTYTYFRAAIPANAAKFKLNNGKNKSGDHEKETGFYDILRLDPDADNTVSGYTKDRLVYLLENDALELKSPNITANPPETVTVTSGEQISNVNYTARNGSDMLYIRDTAAWNIPLNSGIVNFYDTNGDLVGSADTYSLTKTKIETTAEATANGRTSPAVWYYIPIHEDAASFTVTYNGTTTDRYDIYPIGTASSDSGTYTTGNMYYETQGGGVLAVMNNTIHEVDNYQTPTYVTSNKTRDGQGGDYLYLVCSDKTKWQNMTVTFKSGTTTIQSDVPAQYLNYIGFAPAGVEPISGETTSDTNAVGYWYRVAIPQYSSDKPKGAMEFTVTGSDGANSTTTTSAAIYELVTKSSLYKKDYTLGDMQYRLPDTGTKPTLLYPVFTEVDPAEYELGGQSVTTTSLTPVDESEIEPFVGATSAKMPTTTGEAYTNPVLYNTGSSSVDTVTYKWGNSGGSNWTVVNRIYFALPRKYYYNNTELLQSWDSCQINLRKPDSNEPDGYKYSGWKNVNYHDANYSNGHLRTQQGSTPINKEVWYYEFTDTDGWTQVQFRDSDNSHTWYENGNTYYRDTTNFKELSTYEGVAGKGNYFTITTNHPVPGVNADTDIDLENPVIVEYYTSVPSTAATVSYQPEDRYGMISDQNSTTPAVAGTNDVNNFIYITTTTTLTTPVINFYDNTSGTGTPISVALDYTAVMNGTTEVTGTAQPGDGTTTAYKIRLPKNALSFTVSGKSGNNTVTSGLQQLYQDVTISTSTMQPASTGETITLTNFHHAGTTFNYNCTNGAALTVSSLRTGFTPDRAATMTDPLNPRSDSDYVFFTDTNNTIGANGTVYAYLYGGADGEFKAWPGIAASTTPDSSAAHPTGTTAYSTYTDNYGRKVYMFRIPQGDEGTYTHVIFSNGTNTGRKTTQAGAIGSGGKNFILDTTEANRQDYGSFSNAYALVEKSRTTPTAGSAYTTAGTNRYIYIVNNGTQNISNNAVQSGRYILDDIHVEFFDGDNRPVIQGSNGTNYSGLKPDKLNKGYTIGGQTYDVYRIQVPNGARYFRINNGEKDVVGETATQTQWNERQSEMKAITANGLYSFVQGKSDAADYIQSGEDIPADEAARENPHYLLTLINEIQTDEDIPETGTKDIKLATVVTKNEQNNSKGNIDHISWLKLNDEGTQVDRDYLYHTLDDLNNTNVTQVNVVKDGTYYWVERVAPSGYKKSDEEHIFVVENGVVKVYNETTGALEAASPANTVKVVNEPVDNQTEIILKKTAKEKVGTTDIGDILAGAKFKLVAVDGTEYKFTKTAADPNGAIEGKKTHEYTVNSSGTYNVSPNWLETGEDGRLHIKGLPIGDYYLEEQVAPNGYSEYDSNDVVNNTVQKRKVYFSVGVNTTVKEITASDEMAPAYIKLYEHISEKRDAWGDPTFVFKIRQTGYYKNDGTTDIQTIDDGKEILVALTVDDNGKIVDTYKWFGTNGLTPTTFTGDDAISSDYNNWFVEGTTELDDYQGIFDIDSKGRIRVEPGSYEITRLPVSRYEFVTNGKTATYDNDNEPPVWTEYDVNGNKSEKMTISALPQGRTIDVHYYDKVSYYDKFTQMDEEINKFYTLDSSKDNITVKGIRVEDYKVDTETATNPDTLASGTLNVNITESPRFRAYFIMSDGSEQPITSTTELAKFVIKYEYDNTSKDLASFVMDFSYDTNADKITVDDYNTYKKGVYTLTATYDGKFSAGFDIVFERTS